MERLEQECKQAKKEFEEAERALQQQQQSPSLQQKVQSLHSQMHQFCGMSSCDVLVGDEMSTEELKVEAQRIEGIMALWMASEQVSDPREASIRKQDAIMKYQLLLQYRGI